MRTFALLALPGLYLSSLYSTLDILRIGDGHVRERLRENQPRGRLPASWVVKVLSLDDEPVVAAGGARVMADGNLRDLAPNVDAIFIPALDCMTAPRLKEAVRLFADLSPWLAAAHAQGAVIAAHHAGICAVAEAGLLTGADASVPIAMEAWFRQRHPRVHCDHRLTLVQSGGIASAAALDQGPQLACHLVDHFGSQIVSARTRQEVLQAGDHSRPLAAVEPLASDPVIERAQNWFLTRMTERADVGALARHLALSERSLFRRFRETLDVTPLQYLQALRLETARRALERTTTSVEGIARSVGYEDAAFFGDLFHRRFGKTPAAYRRDLRGA